MQLSWICLGFFFFLYLFKIYSFKGLGLKAAINGSGLRMLWISERVQHICNFLYFTFLIQLVIVITPVSQIATV